MSQPNPSALLFFQFDSKTFLSGLWNHAEGEWNKRIEYIRQYLKDLDASFVIEEPRYFDRDFLAEFSAFYSLSVRPRTNTCRRIHVFKQMQDESLFLKALSEESFAGSLNDNYLGFIVVRPIQSAPFGRTVLRWYDQPADGQKLRNTSPSRDYRVHLAGLELEVYGLAWQQQDVGVAACATVAIWSMLHSSALDDNHRIPTTVDITRAAHDKLPSGKNPFPSSGLTVEQIGEAIKANHLSPSLLGGDIDLADDLKFFSRSRFANDCAAFIRSGYPILLFGQLVKPTQTKGEFHAVCVVGFKESAAPIPNREDGDIILDKDGAVEIIYVHDDNLGPNVRFKIFEEPAGGFAKIKPEQPAYSSNPVIFDSYDEFIPQLMIAAVHSELRTNPEDLIKKAKILAEQITNFLFSGDLKKEDDPALDSIEEFGIAISTSFMKLSDFLGAELEQLLSSNPALLRKIRLALVEDVEPMSLHVGLIRIGVGGGPVLDFLCDTTDVTSGVFCHIAYAPLFSSVVDKIAKAQHHDFGTKIIGYQSV